MKYETMVGLAITTAVYRSDWCPNTYMGEVLEQDPAFKNIIEMAEGYLDGDLVEPLTPYDVVEAVWNGEDYDEICKELNTD